jgi:hypothetical protein
MNTSSIQHGPTAPAADQDSPFAGLSGPSRPVRRRTRLLLWLGVGAGVVALLGVGAAFAWHLRPQPTATEPVSAAAPGPEIKRSPLGKGIFLEVQGDQRRVVVQSVVCLREGQLEGLLTIKQKKEHEYILATEASAAEIHRALLVARAVNGHPVQFQPRYVPASGSVIKVSLRYQKDGRPVSEPAQRWICDARGKKDLDRDWVFGGSQFVPDPDDVMKQLYLADQGDVICVCNMDSAMLDLPVPSPKRLEDRVWEAHTDRIPAIGTNVEVVFEPVPEKKK